jgi:hypothetical protein
LAVIGVLFVVYQLWGYIGWILSDQFVSTPPGPDAIPDEIRQGLVRTQWILSLWAIVWTGILVKQWRSTRRVTGPLMLTIAWLSVYWQDPLVNWTGRNFSYNAYLFNRGDWIGHLPFVSHVGPMLTQPLLVEALVFYAFIPALGLLTYGIMRLANHRLHIHSPAALIVIAWLAIAAFDAGFENLASHQRMHTWSSVTPEFALNAGTQFQWPLYEGAFIGLLWGLGGMLIYFRGHRELTVLDDGVATLTAPDHARTAVQVLSIIGLYNILFLAYNVALTLLAHNTISVPSWLRV